MKSGLIELGIILTQYRSNTSRKRKYTDIQNRTSDLFYLEDTCNKPLHSARVIVRAAPHGEMRSRVASPFTTLRTSPASPFGPWSQRTRRITDATYTHSATTACLKESVLYVLLETTAIAAEWMVYRNLIGIVMLPLCKWHKSLLLLPGPLIADRNQRHC